MDITPYVGPILTAVITGGSVYAAVVTKLARLETEMVNLRREVEKHNSIVERTYRLETEVENLYHRYAELKSEIKEER